MFHLTLFISLLGVSFTGNFKTEQKCESARAAIIKAVQESDAAGKISVGECKKSD